MLYLTVVQTLGTLALFGMACSAALLLALVLPGGRAFLRSSLGGNEHHPLLWALGLVTLATAGSLYLSEIAGLLPCKLCWYQRFAMYPMVLILGYGAFAGLRSIWKVALPFSLVGLSISVFHIYVQLNPDKELTSCAEGAPCAMKYLNLFNFVSIPVMAGTVFLLVSLLLITVAMVSKADAEEAPATES